MNRSALISSVRDHAVIEGDRIALEHLVAAYRSPLDRVVAHRRGPRFILRDLARWNCGSINPIGSIQACQFMLGLR